MAAQVAREIWLRAAAGSGTADDLVLAANRVAGQLRTGLGRWIGVEGYRALFGRALVVAQTEHPVLGGLLRRDEPGAPDTAGAVTRYGAEAMAAGMVALLVALIELLGRVIGDEMAVRLVTKAGLPDATGMAPAEVDGGRDG